MMMKNKEPVFHTRESLQLEQRKLRLVIKQQEADLRQRVQKVPGELLYAGVDAVLPAALTGKLSDKILGSARNFVNKSIVQKKSGNTARLITAAKQAGVFTLIKVAYNAFLKKGR